MIDQKQLDREAIDLKLIINSPGRHDLHKQMDRPTNTDTHNIVMSEAAAQVIRLGDPLIRWSGPWCTVGLLHDVYTGTL